MNDVKSWRAALFNQKSNVLSAAQLRQLARAMAHLSGDSQHIDAGYTYFGQFMSHEIVPETNPTPASRNVRPYFTLDSLYGPASQPVLRNGATLFPIGRSIPSGADDLDRLGGVAQIPEPRNDDNAIVAQLHLLWQKFHNFTMTERCAANAVEARRLLTLVFQLLIVEDYLPLILMPEVFDSYFRSHERWLGFDATAVLPEFSHAAFRFGHSMVRSFYDSFPRRPKDSVSLHELFRRERNLHPDLEVEWTRLFGWPAPESGAQGGMVIDANIAVEMTKIPIPGQGEVDIVEKNLEAGQRVGLPSGYEYANALLSSPVGPEIRDRFGLAPLSDLGELGQPDRQLAAAQITIHNLPLWPYLLLEAMHSAGGRHLGPLGSLICAEVLANAIQHAPISIYQVGPAIDPVLASLGELGGRINSVRASYRQVIERSRRANPHVVVPDRPFCMRHLVCLLTDHCKP